MRVILCFKHRYIKSQIPSTKIQINLNIQFSMTKTFGILNFGHCNLPFGLAQGGESFDFAQDREPVERLVEPFDIWDLLFGISVTAPVVI